MGCCKTCMTDCKAWAQFLIMATAIAALALGALALFTCDFTRFDLILDPGESFEFGGRNVTSGKLGLYKIEWEGESCRNMNSEEKNDLTWELKVGRIGIAVGNGLGLIGLLFLLIEFTCCRFKGSRCTECTLFFAAAIGISLSGFFFASDFCQNPGSSLGQGTYPCDFQIGTAYAIASCASYLVVSLLLCVIPKTEPMCVRMKKTKNKDVETARVEDELPEEEEKRGFAFFFCWRGDKKDEEEEEGDAEDAEAKDDGDSVPSNYHDSVAEAEEIPEAVVVGAPMDVQRKASQRQLSIAEEEEMSGSERTRSSWAPTNYFWPTKPEPEAARDPSRDSAAQDMFFDAADDEGSQGNLTAEIY